MMADKVDNDLEGDELPPLPPDSDITGGHSFGSFFRHVEGADEEIGAELQKLVRRLRGHAQFHATAKGTLTVTFNFTMDNRDQLETKYDIKVKEPKRVRPKSTHWVNGTTGELTIEDPRQLKLKPRGVPSAKTKSLATDGEKPTRSL